MYLNINPIIYYLFIIYSIIYLIKSKSKNEFLILLTIFLYLQENTLWEISIRELITSPIVIRTSDIALIILSINIINKLFFIKKIYKNLFNNIALNILIIYIFLVFIISLSKFGYSSIAEFRSKFFFIIIIIYIITNIKLEETPLLIKSLYSYLIPLILILPLFLILNKNFSFSIENRILSAFFYNSIVYGFLSHYLYSKYFKEKISIIWILIFFVSSLYLSHRSVWAMVSVIVILMILMRDIKLSKILLILPVAFVFYNFIILKNYNFFSDRILGITDIEIDPTGKWRLLVWDSVIQNATIFGKGIGARFNVWVDELGGLISYGTHNMYITFLYYTGYVGLLVFVITLLYLAIKFIHYDKKLVFDKNKLINRLSIYALSGSIIYMIGYETDLISWIFISFGLLNINSLFEKN